jgi:DNA-binding response OmpR family regulator
MNKNKSKENDNKSLAQIKSPSSLANHPPRILLAEDDVEMRKMLSWSLEKAGYEVVECQNGNSLMKHLRLIDTATIPQSFDLIISDIRMPGFTGLQVLESAMELGDFPPFILITAFPDEEIKEKVQRQYAVEMFEKPFNVDDLIARIDQIVPHPSPANNQQNRSCENAKKPVQFPIDAVYRHECDSEPVKDFVQDMAAKLNRFGQHILNCRVVIDESDSAHNKKHRYHVNIHVTTSNNVVVVQHDSDEGGGHENLYFAIRIAFATACRKLKNSLRKRRKNKKHLHSKRNKNRTVSQETKGEQP